MTPRVRKDVKDLLATLDSDTPKRKDGVVMVGALIGGIVGAGTGFALVLLVFGLLTGGAQSDANASVATLLPRLRRILDASPGRER